MEELALEIPKILMDKLISGGVKELCSFSQIKSHIKTLDEIKPIVEAWLLNADATQISSDAQLVEFNQLISALEKVHDSLNVREARAMRTQIMSRSGPIKKVLAFFSPSNPIFCAFREAREVKALMDELYRIAGKCNLLGSSLRLYFETASQNKALRVKKGPFTSQVVIGRDKDRDNIIRMLLESSSAQETFSVVCIVGIGGIGKTTLTQYVFRDDSVKKNFDLMIWVCVPQSLTFKDMMQNIVAFATDATHLQGGMRQVAFATDETHLQGGMRQVAFATDDTHLQGGMLQLQCHFQRQITNKKFLLVLDNVWDHKHLSSQWQGLSDLIGFGAPGSMVLTTTRSVRVAKTMGIVSPYLLKDLAKEDSWHLFKRVAFTQAQDPGIEAIGREIVQMCPNVPLVICNIGHHLKGKCSITEWMDFKEKLAHLSCCEQAPNVMEILKLSYDELDPKLKLCFAYCSFFPKDWDFPKAEMIRFWIALGYVESHSENQNLVDIARDYFRRLKDQGFFNSNGFGMHDVMRDLASWVAGPTYKRVYSSKGLEFDDQRIHHLSLRGDVTQPPKDLPYSLIIKLKKQLQSLVLEGHYFKIRKLSLPHFECLRVLSIKAMGLNEMPRTISKLITLRYLDLSGNNFTELPDSVTQLVHLTYLNLSACRELQELPRGLSKLQNLLELDLSDCYKLQKLPTDISKLTNLLSLHLNRCNLQELPREMSKLVKLRALRVIDCEKLRHMPVGLGNCTGLQKLDVFVAKGQSLGRTNPNNPSDSDDYEVGRLAELNRLNNLKGKLRIEVDGKWSSESEARAANLQGKEKLTALEIKFVGGSSRDNEMMLQGFQPNANLMDLWIRGYGGERIPSWIDDNDYLSNLEQITISNWRTCVFLGSFGRLRRLKLLVIVDLPNLEYIESTTTDPSALSAAPLLPSLEVLRLKSLPKWKGWRTMCASSSSGAGAIIFPRLRRIELQSVGLEIVPEEFQGLSSLQYLQIWDSDRLKGIPEWIETLTYLKELVIWDCPQLTSSPEQMVKLSNLHFERGPYSEGKQWFVGRRQVNGSTSS